MESEMSEWISIKSNIPEDNAPCLMSITHGDGFTYCFVGFVFNEKFYDQAGGKITKYKVTHWMPLPEPPKLNGE